MTIADIMQTAPVIPVIVVDEVEHAQPLARALVAGGLPVLEVTLRTPVALDLEIWRTVGSKQSVNRTILIGGGPIHPKEG